MATALIHICIFICCGLMKYAHFSVALSYVFDSQTRNCSFLMIFMHVNDFLSPRKHTGNAVSTTKPPPPPPSSNNGIGEWAIVHNMWNKMNIPLCLLNAGGFFRLLTNDCDGCGSSSGNEKSFDGKLLCDEYKVAWKELWISYKQMHCIFMIERRGEHRTCSATASCFRRRPFLVSHFPFFGRLFRWNGVLVAALLFFFPVFATENIKMFMGISRNLFVLCINSNGLQ